MQAAPSHSIYSTTKPNEVRDPLTYSALIILYINRRVSIVQLFLRHFYAVVKRNYKNHADRMHSAWHVRLGKGTGVNAPSLLRLRTLDGVGRSLMG